MTDYHAAVSARLEDAGKTLMLLPMPRNTRPAGNRSHMPEIVRRYWELWGGLTELERNRIAKERNRTSLVPLPDAIERLDEVLDWLWLIKNKDQRRSVTGRMPIWPENGRHVNSWRDLGFSMRVHHETVRRWYDGGVGAIVIGLAWGSSEKVA